MPFQTLTACDQAAITDVLTAQHQFAPSGPLSATHLPGASELHISLDRAGTCVIDRVSHPPVGGHISTAMANAIANPMIGCRIVHNHPSQGSLSASDWRLMAAQSPGLEDMIAVNSRGSEFRGKVVPSQIATFAAAIPFPFEPSVNIKQNISNALMTKFLAAAHNGSAPPSPMVLIDYMSWMFSHIVNERFEYLGWVEYQATLSIADQNDLHHLAFQKIIADVRQEAIRLFP